VRVIQIMPRKIPRSDLLDELRRLTDDLGQPPSMAEMNDRGRYSAATYVNRFGSWNDALRESGQTPRVNATDTELLDELRRLADELDRSPSVSDVDEHGRYTAAAYIHRFGSFNDAKAEIGLETVSDPYKRHSGRIGRLSIESVGSEPVTYAALPEPAGIDADRVVVEIGDESVALSLGTRLDIDGTGCRIDGLSPAVRKRGGFGWIAALQLRSGRTERVWLSDLADRLDAGVAEVGSP